MGVKSPSIHISISIQYPSTLWCTIVDNIYSWMNLPVSGSLHPQSVGAWITWITGSIKETALMLAALNGHVEVSDVGGLKKEPG